MENNQHRIDRTTLQRLLNVLAGTFGLPEQYPLTYADTEQGWAIVDR